MSKTKKAARPAKKIDVKAADAPEPVEGNEASFARYLEDARALAGDVKPFRADASLAYHNVVVGVEAVVAARAELDAGIKAIDWATVEAVPDLALGVCFGARQVEIAAPPPTGTLAKLAEARVLRARLLTAADALAASSLVPAPAVAKIRAGRGAIDAANDCVDLSALFRKHAAAIKGSHAISAKELARAATLGSELVAVLRPKRAKAPKKDDATLAAVDARDRLWTLLAARYHEVRRLGAWLWVDEASAHVPELQAHRGAGSKPRKPTTPTTPTPTAMTG